jgi:glycosyltransferase 2 family protein
LGAFYSIGHRGNVERLIIGVSRKLGRLLRRDYDIDRITTIIGKFYSGIQLMSTRRWVKIGAGSVMNILLDMLTLYLFYLAAGYPIKPGVMVAGYGLAFLLGRGSFFVPGGIGVIEGGMVAIYTSLGIPIHINVVAVLAYRFVSFWLPTLLGFGANIYLGRTSA